MKAYLFPGQGAQRIGMGADLFDAYPDLTWRAGEILDYDIAALCRDGPIEKLSQTQFTQPALYVVNALRYLKHRDETGETPDFLLGHSVSEYVALFAAGVLDFATGLSLVARRGALMAEARGGGMAAVLGLDPDAVAELIAREGLADIYPANFNTPRQIVVSGRKDAIVAAEPLFLATGASHYKVLPVSGAFHTPFMEAARAEFAGVVAAADFSPQQVPVISNVTARPHVDADIRARMVEQITAPVRWAESLRYLMARGVAFTETVELGPDGPPVVRPMFRRTEMEAGPLPPEEMAVAVPVAAAATPEPAFEAAAPAAQPIQPTPSGPVADAGAAPCPERSADAVLSEVASPQVSTDSRPCHTPRFSVERLGSRAFCDAFGIRHPYASGAMYRGIASTDIVIRMANAGLLGFFGAAGLSTAEVRNAIRRIRSGIPDAAPFGVNFIARVNRPHLEDELTDLLLEEGVTIVEASAFMEVTPALVRYRAKGLTREAGRTRARNRVVAKVSRPDVAAQFLAPAPDDVVKKLRASEAITGDEAELLAHLPMADAICVESDSGGHTDQGMPFALIPPILKLRDDAQMRFPDAGPIFVGAAGGIGTPEAAAAVLVLGADFLVTGSINQCTVEAGTSDAVKDLLEAINVYDTAYAPSGEMFELGSKVQVLKKGVFFPARAEKLVTIYRQHESLEAIDPALRRQIEERYFHKNFEEVYADLAKTYAPVEIARAEAMPKHRMALVFKRYFRDTTDWALAGEMAHKVDFQVHCGPAQGAFNQWVAGTELESWPSRHVDDIALKLLDGTADLLSRRFSALVG
ncbi:trans-AT polyketide synthase/acyltransferase/oxidoreductase domain-containing protein [Rhodobium orientis]|uniref:[acyl-carrier-protein] S-malonyltransferase n=1 Tax=Rhodobium orientis TaxID=34017 RepID=A0A327JW91_9HYPH|nr:ACP S-malonyltransferase [Rhodobium orientis]MBB4302683.1 trans-AT polyketide synthase/acyltransferase/oxidoreductase domain-containing protein [Rhodobium orientis]MBK5948465.1 [acyl-carrier-protein] S-malonyltransferase [Rhodobium orientis]RAI29855.1 [acyl-carrier-protein] S-malonyltransferase [Rhodobium orientis]